MAVTPIGPVVTVEPVAIAVDAVEISEISGWNGEELYPCRYCGSTGRCEHLVKVIWLERAGGDGKRPVGVRAELGAEAGRRQLQELRADLICCSAEGEVDG